MTCIIGYVDEKETVWMYSDSLGYSEEGSQSTRTNPKLFFLNNQFLVGFAGSFRAGQVMQYMFTPPKFLQSMDEMEYMVTLFLPALKKVLEKEGAMKSEDGEAFNLSMFLIGFRGRLFQIESDFQCGEDSYPYAAIGAGDGVARGALFGLLHGSGCRDPQELLVRAMLAAQEFTVGVRGPYVLEKLEMLK